MVIHVLSALLYVNALRSSFLPKKEKQKEIAGGKIFIKTFFKLCCHTLGDGLFVGQGRLETLLVYLLHVTELD